jgi:hypothetical protein
MKTAVEEWITKAEGDYATKEDAQDAIQVCRSFRRLARQSLGLTTS